MDNKDQLSKEDIKQLEEDISIIKEYYLKELEREKNERDLQATRDSEQAELSVKEKLKIAENEKLVGEQEAKELKEFREKLINSLNAIEKKDNTTTLTNLDTNLSLLVESLEKQEEKEQVSHFTDLSITFFLWGCLPVYFAYKSFYKFFSDTVY